MSISSCPTPTVSIRTISLPLASSTVATSAVARRQAAQRAAGRHAADKDSRIGVVRLHAYAVTQDRTAGVGTGGIDRDDPDGLVLFAILARQLVNERTFSRAGRAGEPITCARPLCGNSSRSSEVESAELFSMALMARASARTSPARTRSITLL